MAKGNPSYRNAVQAPPWWARTVDKRMLTVSENDEDTQPIPDLSHIVKASASKEVRCGNTTCGKVNDAGAKKCWWCEGTLPAAR
jgi:hypothetical protein